jgi:hypothetical protein
MRVKSLLAAAFCVAAIAGAGASAASAGEITGNGKPLWTSTIVDPLTGEVSHTLHGNSACAFSGQEDLQYVDEAGQPLDVQTKGDPGHAQSWGQIPKAFRPTDGNPGTFCNPTKGGGEG